MSFTEKQLEADRQLMEQIHRYRDATKLNEQQKAILEKLEHQYYVENSAIRLYWKLY